MKTNDYMKEMNSLIKAAKDTDFTLKVKEIAYFIIVAVNAISYDFKMKRMKTIRTIDEVIKQLNEYFLDEYFEVISRKAHTTSRDVLYEISHQAFTLLSGKDYKKETLELIQRIKQDADFAQHFFYDDHFDAGKNIAGLRLSLIKQIKKDYGITMKAETVSTIIYEHLWSEGTWSNLDAYNYRSTFHHWLGTVSSRCIIAFLMKNDYIHPSYERTTSNTKLCWKKQDPDYCAMAIDELIHIPLIHDYLYALCVDRLDKEAIQMKYGMDDKMSNLMYKISVESFKTALLNTENNYENLLEDKSLRKIKVSADVIDFKEWNSANDTDTVPFDVYFGINSEDSKIDEKATRFLTMFSERIFRKEVDQFIWQERYLKTTSPVVLAKILGHTRAWVDTRYSRLNKKYWLALDQYWQQYSSYNKNLLT